MPAAVGFPLGPLAQFLFSAVQNLLLLFTCRTNCTCRFHWFRQPSVLLLFLCTSSRSFENSKYFPIHRCYRVSQREPQRSTVGGVMYTLRASLYSFALLQMPMSNEKRICEKSRFSTQSSSGSLSFSSVG